MQVSHAMVLHEHKAYRDLWSAKRSRTVVLAHTSVYWGASALGQLSIALAFSGTVVWTEAVDVADLHRCIKEEGVTVLGVVPDHLDLLAPEAPEHELPSVEIVFTWGERLPRRVADRWRSHSRAILRELLISTEYWLALYADPLGDGTLRTVSGVETRVLGDDGHEVGPSEVGELCIAGPMVTPGYVTIEGLIPPPDVFCTFCGRSFFRTRDLVRRVPGGLIYKGRADMMAKERGKWVDMLAVEDALQRLNGVAGARVLADPHGENFHAFVVFENGCPAVPVLNSVRTVLPHSAQLRAIPALPRHPVTRKVDDSRLKLSLARPPTSWPTDGVGSRACLPQADHALLSERLSGKVTRHCGWTMATFAVLVMLSSPEEFWAQSVLMTMWASLTVAFTSRSEDNVRYRRAAFSIAAWLVATVAIRPRHARLLRFMLSMAGLPYFWYAVVYADNTRHHKTHQGFRLNLAKFVMGIVDRVPFLKLGLFATLSYGRCWLPRPLAMSCSVMLFSLTGFGIAATASRRRFLAWPIVFWSAGCGNQLEIECGAWLRWEVWAWEARRLLWLPKLLLRSVATIPELTRSLRGTPEERSLLSNAPSGEDPTAPGDESRWQYDCTRCQKPVEQTKWPPFHKSGRRMCFACGDVVIPEELEEYTSWLKGEVHKVDGGETCEPNAKRPRREQTGDGNDNGQQQDHGVQAEKALQASSLPSFPDEGSQDEHPGARKEMDKMFRRFERWWWRTRTEEAITFTKQELEHVAEVLNTGGASVKHEGSPQPSLSVSSEPPSVLLDRLCSVVSQTLPALRPVVPQTSLFGLDSMAVARLAYAIRTQMGYQVNMAQLRETPNLPTLAAIIEKQEPIVNVTHSGSDLGREYSVWFSPGQYSPMGAWVLRSDEDIDYPALRTALAQLVERHPSLRAKILDPLHYMSVTYDASVLWSFLSPFYEACGYRWVLALKRLIGWAFTQAWPRITCCTREEIYGERFPEHKVPLEILKTDSFENKPFAGQARLERELKRLKSLLRPPMCLTVYELRCYLVDIWHYNQAPLHGRFAIIPKPSWYTDDEAKHVYIDIKSREWGPLVATSSSRWETPPYGFPALFYVPLSSGACVWIRVESSHELRMCYNEKTEDPIPKNFHFSAYRAAPLREKDETYAMSTYFLSICMVHAFADGNCYMPLAQDLFSLYDAARSGKHLNLPVLPNPLEALERRLASTMQGDFSPLRTSLRGAMFRYWGGGYGYSFHFPPCATAALSMASSHYRVPLDVLLLGLVVTSLAAADEADLVDFTLYSPMRDGPAEALMIGLFADWRDLAVGVDFELATVLGTMMQLMNALQQRQWTPFNALRKPERTIVNIQPLDMERRSHFTHLGENLWHGGDVLGHKQERPPVMDWGRQPLTFNIEQQDETTWWILIDIGHKERESAWTRKFATALKEALHDLLFNPFAKVHRSLGDPEWQAYKAWEVAKQAKRVSG